VIGDGQLSIDDAIAAGDAGMAQAHDNAPAEWRDRAWEALAEWLRTRPLLHVDDFWAEADIEEPPEPRALGALFRRAAREGMMTKTDQWLPSVRSHGAPKVVWRSLVYDPDR
jgi:hypothetical protein